MNKRKLRSLSELFGLARQELPDQKYGDCVMCEKLKDGTACCEVYGFVMNVSAPVIVTPPYDTACGMFSTTERVRIDSFF